MSAVCVRDGATEILGTVQLFRCPCREAKRKHAHTEERNHGQTQRKVSKHTLLVSATEAKEDKNVSVPAGGNGNSQCWHTNAAFHLHYATMACCLVSIG